MKIKLSKNSCEILGKGLNGFDFKNITLNAAIWTLARLIMGL